MSTLRLLLEKHGASLADHHRSAIVEYLRRLDARREYAFPKGVSLVEAQSGYVLFERVFSAAPVDLFGQDVPSLAHTMIRIFRARAGATDAALEHGEEIYAARISEKSLTEAMLQVGQASRPAPVTVTKLGEFDTPTFVPEGSAVNIGGSSYRTEQVDGDREALEAIRELVSTGPNKPTAALKDAVSHLERRTADATNISFVLSRHLESMGTLRNEVLTEASYAALHAQKVMQSLGHDVAALPAPHGQDWDVAASLHPLVDAALDALWDDMRDGLGQLILAEITALSVDHPKLANWIVNEDGVDTVRFPAPRERGIALSYDSRIPDARAHIDEMSSLWNHAFNESIATDRDRRRANQGALLVSRREGWTGHLHSSLPPSNDGSFALSFLPAYDEYRFGVRRIDTSHRPLIEIEMTGQDLMTALRGHPEGTPIPCTFRAIAGQSKRSADRPDQAVEADIKAGSKELAETAEAQQLHEAVALISDLVHSKRSGKAWQEEVLSALQGAYEAHAAFQGCADHHIDEAKSAVNAHVAASAQHMLKSISTSLPSELLERLSLPSS